MERPDFEDHRRYRDWRLLGRGGGRETWRAFDRITDSQAVVKIDTADEEGLARAKREQMAVRSLRSPYLQRLFDVLRSGDRVALVYEFIPGTPLRERLDAGPLPEITALEVVRDVVEGLRHLHENALLHRDISPENIILAAHGAVLIDFDAFGQLQEQSRRLGPTTRIGEFAGKPLYMSPEQLYGAQQSRAADLWAVGAVLYECLTGRHYRQQTDIRSIIESSNAAPDVAEVPTRFRDLVARLLAPDPEARPSADEAAEIIAGLIPKASGSAQSLVRTSRAPRVVVPESQPVDAPENFRDLLEQEFGPQTPSPASPPASEAVGRTQVPPSRSRGGLRFALVLAVLVFGVGVAGALVYLGGTLSLGSQALLPVGLMLVGVLVAMVGLFLSQRVRERAEAAEVALPFRAIDLINAPDARAALSQTICMGIDAYREAAGAKAQEMLTVTMVALAKEYADADSADARFRALQMLNELHGKVSRTLRPWWLDYEAVIARGIALTSLLGGAAAAAEGVRRLF